MDVVTFAQKNCTFGAWGWLAETRFQVSAGRSPQVPGETKATSLRFYRGWRAGGDPGTLRVQEHRGRRAGLLLD